MATASLQGLICQIRLHPHCCVPSSYVSLLPAKLNVEHPRPSCSTSHFQQLSSFGRKPEHTYLIIRTTFTWWFWFQNFIKHQRQSCTWPLEAFTSSSLPCSCTRAVGWVGGIVASVEVGADPGSQPLLWSQHLPGVPQELKIKAQVDERRKQRHWRR